MPQDKLLKICDGIMVFAFCAMIYFLPISIALTESFAGLAQFIFFIKRGILFRYNLSEVYQAQEEISFWQELKIFLRSFKPVPSFLSKPIGIFILINFLSIFISHYPGASITGFFFKVLQGCFLTFMFIECMTSRRRLMTFLSIFMISATLIGINGVAQFIGGKGFIHGYEVVAGGIRSSFKHYNDFGSYLLIIVMPCLSVLLSCFLGGRKNAKTTSRGNQKNRFCSRRIILGVFVLFALSLACVGLTFSRGTWLGLFAALFFLSARYKKAFYIPIGIALIFFVVSYPMLKDLRNVTFFTDNVTHDEMRDLPTEPTFSFKAMEQGMDRLTELGRNEFWQEAVHIIREFPILGTGLNTYARVAPAYKNKWGGYPHNCYLQMTAETGFLGLFAFFGIILTLIGRSLRNFRRMEEPLGKALGVGFLAGIFGFLVHSFVDTNLYSVQLSLLFWTMIGFIVAIQKVPLQGVKS